MEMGGRVIGISGSLILSKTLMELIFNPCGDFRWSPEGPVNQIHFPNLHIACVIAVKNKRKRNQIDLMNTKLPY